MTQPSVIYEEPEFAVVLKPAGLIVHRPRLRKGNSDEAALTDWLLQKYPEVGTVGDDPSERPGIVHRLDKETSGVLIVPRTEEAFRFFKEQFQAHTIKKTYLAVVHGELPETGTVDRAIGIKDGSVKRSVHSEKFAKPAVTKFRRIRSWEEGGTAFSLAEVFPETGRTHQIRVHLASIAHPIVGDPLYGKKKEPVWATRLMLHAAALEFTAPSGRTLRIEAEMPREFERTGD
jgi:23S rRNA pseudouridine1911/1915/1917 synthase